MFVIKKLNSPSSNSYKIIGKYMSARIAAYHSKKYNQLAEKSNSNNLFWVDILANY